MLKQPPPFIQMLPEPSVKGLPVPLALCTKNLCVVCVTPRSYFLIPSIICLLKPYTAIHPTPQLCGGGREMKKQKLSSLCSQPVAQLLLLRVLPFQCDGKSRLCKSLRSKGREGFSQHSLCAHSAAFHSQRQEYFIRSLCRMIMKFNLGILLKFCSTL